MKILRKTKIICTIGPATSDPEMIRELIKAGMNIARFNFSHGTHDYHLENIRKVRRASEETGIPVALLLDTKGPEIRTGPVKDGNTIRLDKGRQITLTTEEVEGTADYLSISYQRLPREVEPGKHIYIADGIVDLVVNSVSGKDIHCTVMNGGEIGSRKNVNVVGVKTSLPAITEKDEEDILFAIRENMDFIAASFIRRASDVQEICGILMERESRIQVIAKIEDEEGLENIEDIIRISDGVMIARGDLGVQLSTEEIPLAQKRIIEKCNKWYKPVITATQMLDSMIHNPKPTRAESNDVANAIFDGTDAVMLSGETAGGKYPIESVQTMHSIALAVEQSPEYFERSGKYFSFHMPEGSAGRVLSENFGKSERRPPSDIANSVARAAYVIATDVNASALLAPTMRGTTPRLISAYRPRQTIIAATPSQTVQRQLLLNWGVYPILTGTVLDSDDMIQNAIRGAFRHGYVERFEKIVVVAGIPIRSPIMMNTIRVLFLGNILNRGGRAFGGICTGRILKARSAGELSADLKYEDDVILLAPDLDQDYLPFIPKVRGVILEGTSLVPWETLRELNPNLVFISMVSGALEQFEDKLTVSLDGNEKIIYEGVIRGEP